MQTCVACSVDRYTVSSRAAVSFWTLRSVFRVAVPFGVCTYSSPRNMYSCASRLPLARISSSGSFHSSGSLRVAFSCSHRRRKDFTARTNACGDEDAMRMSSMTVVTVTSASARSSLVRSQVMCCATAGDHLAPMGKRVRQKYWQEPSSALTLITKRF